MTVWYSSFDEEIISDHAHEEYLNNLIESYDTEENFKEFLDGIYYSTELFNFTDADREKARQEFEDWLRERADNDDMYESYEVRFANDEVEE